MSTSFAHRLVRDGTAAIFKGAQIHLRVDIDGADGWCDLQTCKQLDRWFLTIRRVRQQLVADGFHATLHWKRQTGRKYRKLAPRHEAQRVAGACWP